MIKLTIPTFIPLLFIPFYSYTQHTRFESGLSIRNNKKSHYQKMVEWDDSEFEELAWWEENDAGSVIDFMNLRALFPEGYDENDHSKKYPAIIMLHGVGESGRKWTYYFDYDPTDSLYDNNGHQIKGAGMAHLKAVRPPASQPVAFPGIAIFPQSSYNAAWSGPANIHRVVQIIEHMIKDFNVDPDRIYLHGLSNGAKGVWELASERPDLFAAILPMSGVGSDKERMTEVLVTTPIWLFQGGQDINPTPGNSIQWIEMLVNKGGSPRYTLYTNNGHDTWHDAYNEPDFFSWMLEKNKKDIYAFGDTSREVTAENTLKLGFSAGFLQYQWTRDGVFIKDANSRYFTASGGGTYMVKYQSVIDGTWRESYPLVLNGPEGQEVLVGTSREITTSHRPIIYPNPFHDKLTIKNGNERETSTELLIFNLGSGQKIMELHADFFQGEAVLDLKNLPQGHYLIQIENSNYKIIKQ